MQIDNYCESLFIDSFANNEFSICRFCLKNCPFLRTISSAAGLPDVSEVFEAITSIPLEQSTQYSNKICKNCDKILNDAYRIRADLIRIDQYWKQFLKGSNCIFSDNVRPLPIEEIKLEPIAEEEFTSVLACSQSTEDSSIRNISVMCDIKSEDDDEKIANEDLHMSTADESETGNKSPNSLKKRFYKNSKIFNCGLCDDSDKVNFQKNKNLREHIIKFHKITCIQCNLRFARINLLKRHMKSEHRKTVMIIMQKEWIKKVKEKKANPKQPLNCHWCDHEFRDFPEINEHVNKQHSNETKLTCDICGNQFINKRYIGSHMSRVHRVPKRHKCPYCEKMFRLRAVWTQHVRTHTGDKPHVCEYCGHGCAQLAQLKAHTRKKHTNASEKVRRNFTCSLCKYTCEFITQLERHANSHGPSGREMINNMRATYCNICNQYFNDRYEKSRHMIVHYTYECDKCTKRFSKKSCLTVHLETHRPGYVPLICQVCGRTFEKMGNYKVHLRRHEQPPNKDL